MPGPGYPGPGYPGQPMPGQMPMGGMPGPGYPGQGYPGQMPMGQPMMMGGPIMVSGTTAGIAMSAKRGMGFTIFMVCITTLPILAVMVYTFADFSGEDYCEKAAECCEEISGSAAGAACKNFESGMPVEGCKQALEGFKRSPGGKKCK